MVPLRIGDETVGATRTLEVGTVLRPCCCSAWLRSSRRVCRATAWPSRTAKPSRRASASAVDGRGSDALPTTMPPTS